MIMVKRKEAMILYKQDEFYLMNKDEIVLKFYSVEVGDKQLFNIDVQSIRKLPPKFKDITSFLESRTIITHRAELLESLRELGIRTRFDLLLMNHVISLVDTLWIKRCTDGMSWNVVSPYTKERIFSMSWFLNDSKLNLKEFRECRPEYSTNGNFPKCWMTRDTEHILVKCGSSGAYNSGLEPFSEVYAMQVEDALDFKNHRVEYRLISLDYSAYKSNYKLGKLLRTTIDTEVSPSIRFVTECTAFTSEKIGFVSAGELGLNSYEEIVEYAKKLGKEENIAKQFILDALLVNTDRHLGNIGFLYDNDTFEIIDVAPVFDNNISLLCYWVEQLDGEAMDYVATCTSKIGMTFEELGKYGMSYVPALVSELRNISKYFEFQTVGNINFKRERLDALSDVVRKQAEILWML